MINKNEIYARALKYHSKTGRVVKALDKVFTSTYPAGTNLIVKFLDDMIGLPYKHTNMVMDAGIDCAEMPRVAYYIFFGMDIGVQSYTQYNNPKGKVITTNWPDLPKCRPLTLAFYDTNADKKCDHVAVIHDAKHLIQSGAAKDTDGRKLNAKVAITDIMWHPKNTKGKFLCAKDFLSDDQYNSLIVGGKDTDMLIQMGDKSDLAAMFQRALISAGFKGDMDTALIGEFGSRSAAATKLFQKTCGLPETGEVDNMTAAAMWERAREAEISALQERINEALPNLQAAQNVLTK